MLFRPFVVFSSLLGCLLAQVPAPESVFPNDAPVQIGETRWQACRVVDAVTGAPIVGAELLLIDPRRTPLPREFWSKRVGLSDDAGFVRVRSDDLRGGFGMLLLRAKGYAASVSGGAVPSLVWPLTPAVDVPVEVRDWQGRPLAGVQLGLCLGSPNTPDIAFATSDASGLAVFPGIDPHNPVNDVHAAAPEWSVINVGRIDWAPGDHPVVAELEAGHKIAGVVLDANGKPKAGVKVGAPVVARGPWAVTGEDGSFVLEGSAADPDFVVIVGRQVVNFERPDGDAPFVLKLPEFPAPEGGESDAADEGEAAEGDEGNESDDDLAPTDGNRRRRPRPMLVEREELPEGPLVDIELRVTDPSGKPVEELEITLRGPLPRFRFIAEDVRDGVANSRRLAGKYLVTTSSPRFESMLGTIEVAGEKASVALVATPFAELPVRLEGRESVGSIRVRTAQGSRDVDDAIGDDGTGTILVPSREPFCLVVGNDVGNHVVRTTLAEAKANGPFVLRGVGPTKVRGTIVGADGKAVAADVAVLSRFEALLSGGLDLGQLELKPADAGTFELTTPHEGLAFVVAVPRDDKLRPAILPVTLPRRGPAATADLGKLALAAAPQFMVQHADGTPCIDTMAQVVRVGWHDVRKIGPMFALDGKGRLVAPPLRAGDAVVVPAADWDIDREPAEGEVLVVDLPFRTVLQGNGPWNVKLPSGRVAVTLKDKAGEPVDGRIFVGDRSIAVPGRLELRQVPPGKHQVVVVARDRDSVVTTIDVGAEGISELVVEMSDRH